MPFQELQASSVLLAGLFSHQKSSSVEKDPNGVYIKGVTDRIGRILERNGVKMVLNLCGKFNSTRSWETM